MKKYIKIRSADFNSSWTNGQQFCRDTIGTDLASVHSESDNQEVRFLCELESIQHNYYAYCWIGLYRDDDTFEWSDGTEFDYGTDISGVNGRDRVCYHGFCR